MKKSLKTMATAILISSMSTAVLADNVAKYTQFVGDMRYASFCKAVVLDDVRILRASLSRQVGRIAGSKREVLRRLTNEDGMTCNGENLVDFSKRRNANDVYTYLTTANR